MEFSLRLLLFLTSLLGLCNAHIGLTFPPARMLDLDFLDIVRTRKPCGMPKGKFRTQIMAGSEVNVTWHLSYPHVGGFRLELLDKDEKFLMKLSDPTSQTSHITGDPTTLWYKVKIPDTMTCEDCTLRLLREANEWANYGYWSCADIAIVKSTSFKEDCLGRGKPSSLTGCSCDKGYWGPRCQYKDECDSDEDCGNGKCIDIGGTSLPRKQCFCAAGFHGDGCKSLNKVTLPTPENLQLSSHVKTVLSDRMQLYHKMISEAAVPDDEKEIEFVLVVNGTSYGAVGWRPSTIDKSCKDMPAVIDENMTITRKTRAAKGKPYKSNPTLLEPLQMHAEPEPSMNNKRSTGNKMIKEKTTTKPKPNSVAVAEPEPTAEPESEPKPGTNGKPEPSAEPESISEPKPESISEPKPEPGTKAKPEPSAEPESISEPKPEPGTKAKPEPSAEPESISEPKPEPGTKGKPEPSSEPESISEPKPESITKGKPGPCAEPESEPETSSEPKAEPESTSELKAKPEGAASEPHSEPESTSEPKPEPEGAASEPEAEPEPTTNKSALKIKSQVEPEPSPEISSEPEPQAETKPEPEPEASAPKPINEPAAEPETSASEPVPETSIYVEPEASASALVPASEPQPESEPEQNNSHPPEVSPFKLEKKNSVYTPVGDFHVMDCTDIVIGTARGMYSRIRDHYTRDRSTPRVDTYWGGTEDLTSATGWEINGITTLIFRRKLKSMDPTDHTISGSMLLIWARGQEHGEYQHIPKSGLEREKPSIPNFYTQDELKYHGKKDQRGVQFIDFS